MTDDSELKKLRPRRAINKSHGKRHNYVKYIRECVRSTPYFGPLDKFKLAGQVVEIYNIPIGLVNREIERAKRYYDIR